VHFKTGIFLVVIGQALAGCGRSASLSTPTPTPDPRPTYTLSGTVFIETPEGRVPLDRVRIEEANSHRSAMTDKDGFYSLPGLYAATNSVSASRWYIPSYTNALTISGDTRLDIELPSYVLSGVVFERTPTGTEPIEGVEVYCDGCGSPFGHTSAITDAHGFYSLAYTFPGINPLLIWKDGYGDLPGQPPGTVRGSLSRQPMVNGNTKFDIELARH
jgi:hypothetical protein